jgi:hypothetical protein
MEARVLIKYRTSKCNKSLLAFLQNNAAAIKKRVNLRVVIVYDELYPKLKGKVSKLPALILNGALITGNNAIQGRLGGLIKDATTGKAPAPAPIGDDLESFWNDEMNSGVDEEYADDKADKVRSRAMDAAMETRKQSTKKTKRIAPAVSNPGDAARMDNIQPDKISEMIDDDPIMRKFWENQETSDM